MTGKAKRQRALHHKNKTGCGTCKIRHKRCDETKPICENCRTTGRICDGYIDSTTGLPFGGHPQASSSLGRPRVSVSISPPFTDAQEAQGFHFFEIGTALQLANSLNDHWWTAPILQLGHSDPAVRHAVIALGVLSKRYEVHELGVHGVAEADALHQTAMGHYSKAVAMFNRPTLPGSLQHIQSPESRLTFCILLAIFDFLRGDADGTLSHICGGAAVASRVNGGELGQRLLYLLAIADMIRATWLGVEPVVHTTDLQFQDLYMVPPPPLSSGLQPLSKELMTMANDIMTFRNSAVQTRGGDSDIAPGPVIIPFSQILVESVKQTLLARLDLWHDAFSKAVSVAEASTYRYAVLRANYLMLVIMVNIAHCSSLPTILVSEDSGGNFSREFSDIVHLAEASLAEPLPSKRYDVFAGEEVLEATGLLPVFSFRLGLIRPLFFVAQNAPLVPLRQRAHELLLARPWREAAWDSASMGLIAKRSLEAQCTT